MEEMIAGYKENPETAREAMPRPVEPVRTASSSESGLPLNEVGIMAVMEARRHDSGKA